MSKKISILGDSYSSYGGAVPAKNRSFYNGESTEEDTESVHDTWWDKLITYKGYTLEVNQSSSGSPVCNTGYHGSSAKSHSFITRMVNIGTPDIIAVFGGTNDSWAGAPIGELVYENQTEEDLKSFRPAFAYMCDYLKRTHPQAQIYKIINSGLSEAVTSSIKEICEHYSIKWIQLPDFPKPFGGHPGKEGQNIIFKAVKDII